MNKNAPVELHTGMLVFTSDGDELGRIKAIDRTCFQIDIPVRMDFWLEKGTVDSTDFGVARLNLPKDAFNQQTDEDTGHTGFNPRHPAIHLGHMGVAGHMGIHQH
jgi:hypothetical protein